MRISGFDFPLFHGTSSIFLEGIRTRGLGGTNIIRDWGVYEFVAELSQLIDETCADLDGYTFERIAMQVTGNSNFQHGDVYLSPSRGVAARYAATNRYGSEIISEAMLRVERMRDHDGVRELLQRFPDISSLVDITPTPVLVTLDAAYKYRYSTEHGERADALIDELCAAFRDQPEMFAVVYQQHNLRLADVVPFEELRLDRLEVTGSISGFPVIDIKPLAAGP